MLSETNTSLLLLEDIDPALSVLRCNALCLLTSTSFMVGTSVAFVKTHFPFSHHKHVFHFPLFLSSNFCSIINLEDPLINYGGLEPYSGKNMAM